MKLTPRVYTYLLFRVSSENKASPSLDKFFTQWMNALRLKAHPCQEIKHPDFLMRRLAVGKETAISIIRCHDIDIVEIEQRQTEPGNPFAFWEKSAAALEAVKTVPACFGTARVLFSPSDTELFRKAGTIKKYAGLARGGKLYDMENHNYLFLSHKSPDAFLNWYFPAMFSAVRKLAFEEKELQKIRSHNAKTEKQIQEMLSAASADSIKETVPDIKAYQSYFQRSTARLAKLRETLDISILTLENYCDENGIKENTLFAPLLKKARHNYKQADYDLSYARAALEEIESRLRFLDLKIHTARLKIERRIECFVTFIGIFLAVGGATTNMPSEKDGIRLAIMLIAALLVTLIWLFLPGLRKWKFNRKRFVSVRNKK